MPVPKPLYYMSTSTIYFYIHVEGGRHFGLLKYEAYEATKYFVKVVITCLKIK